ncbi:acyl-CoA dehydrogenase family protein [Bradyrhizobium tropiciagri]|uniref:acyl-CoA dehydrogenase family protein n=1 Tax=Bradyrhizobium tropiciagri TaxID=312253 RepID=UPI00067D0B98|nr:acyl-CoA dehydrogenase family protein [Bradyrhizobium tropiciagri]
MAADGDCLREISMLKAICGELVNEVVYACVQFHGAMGVMRESPIERIARDARILSIAGGATEVCWRWSRRCLEPDARAANSRISRSGFDGWRWHAKPAGRFMHVQSKHNTNAVAVSFSFLNPSNLGPRR